MYMLIVVVFSLAFSIFRHFRRLDFFPRDFCDSVVGHTVAVRRRSR